MHRSGTSALAGTLVCLGADPPRSLQPGDENNEAGYWESERLREVSDEALSLIGLAWDRIDAVSDTWLQSEPAQRLRARAAELLRAEYGDSPLFVFKDPRVTRLWPFWRDALAECGAEASFLIPVRNPLEVASSLKVRDGIAPGRGLLLWLRYMLDAEFQTRGERRAFVSYADLLRDWRSVTRRAGERCGVAWPRVTAHETELKIESFLSSRLRHHEISRGSSKAGPRSSTG